MRTQEKFHIKFLRILFLMLHKPASLRLSLLVLKYRAWGYGHCRLQGCSMWARTCIQTSTHMLICAQTCIHPHVCAHIYVHLSTCMHSPPYVCVHMYSYVCAHTSLKEVIMWTQHIMRMMVVHEGPMVSAALDLWAGHDPALQGSHCYGKLTSTPVRMHYWGLFKTSAPQIFLTWFPNCLSFKAKMDFSILLTSTVPQCFSCLDQSTSRKACV